MKRIKRNTIYNGRVIDVYNDEVELSDGRITYREVVEHYQVAAVVAVDEQNKILIEKQYRYPVSKELYEIPAGLIEEGESPLDAAKRELLEETGYKALNWQKAAEFYTSPGMHDEVVHLYIATGLINSEEQNLDIDEELTFEFIKLDDLLKMIYNNEIPDSKTMIGIMMYAGYADKKSAI